jgi:hypothetical protein
MILTLTNLEGEESFDASMLGQAEEVVQERISDDELVLIKGWVYCMYLWSPLSSQSDPLTAIHAHCHCIDSQTFFVDFDQHECC